MAKSKKPAPTKRNWPKPRPGRLRYADEKSTVVVIHTPKKRSGK